MNNLASHRRLPSADALVKEVERIQKEMLELVHELKFEEAAVLRDRMKAIDHILLLLPGRD
ncbi:MAG: UvrB/UvrC motif-containing protein [Anaerobiospirillum succiniciproducens]|nr:UvrB/UvrC motif-containing protein [Anaerobiospirillum succiniciproducens]MDO4675368.1 UvrB/UvrC motif-containing protein [Anaerobiospirillum succiniciproducens]MDY2797847.1 UvrB/UvrC motif-containing protein [Anaerobiospirillum succiniciproducens]